MSLSASRVVENRYWTLRKVYGEINHAIFDIKFHVHFYHKPSNHSSTVVLTSKKHNLKVSRKRWCRRWLSQWRKWRVRNTIKRGKMIFHVGLSAGNEHKFPAAAFWNVFTFDRRVSGWVTWSTQAKNTVFRNGWRFYCRLLISLSQSIFRWKQERDK